MRSDKSSLASRPSEEATIAARNAFLIYANRSGSTLLAAQLSERLDTEQLLVIPEFRLVEYLFDVGDERARRLGPKAIRSMVDDDRQISANLGLSRDDLVSILQQTSGQGILAKLTRVLEAYVAANLPEAEPEVVLWKWGNAATHVDEISRLLPGARFVHVIRDGRGVVNSLLRSESPYFPGEDLARGSTLHGVDHWKSSLRRNTEPRRVGLEVLDVQYGDLVHRPEEVCGTVSRFLGLESQTLRREYHRTFKVSEREQGIHRLVTESPHPERIEGWQSELAEWRRYIVERRAGEDLLAWGYDLEPTPIPAVRRMVWLGRAQAERLLGFVKWSFRRVRQYKARMMLRLLRLRIKSRRAASRSRRSDGDRRRVTRNGP